MMIDWEVFKRQLQANPRKMLGYVLSISVCFLLIWLLVAIRFESPTEPESTDQTNRLDSLRISLNSAPDTNNHAAGMMDQTQSPITGEHKSVGTGIGNLFPAVLILFIAIILLWMWKKHGATTQQSNTSLPEDLFEIIGRQEISSGQEIIAVKINNEFWVLGNGVNGLQLLQRYSTENWEGPELKRKAEEEKKGSVFSKILKSRQSKEMEAPDATV